MTDAGEVAGPSRKQVMSAPAGGFTANFVAFDPCSDDFEAEGPS